MAKQYMYATVMEAAEAAIRPILTGTPKQFGSMYFTQPLPSAYLNFSI